MPHFQINKSLQISQTLEDILSYQSSPLDKLGLGYIGESSRKYDNSSKDKYVRKREEMLMLPVPAKERRRVKTTTEEILLQGDLQMVSRIQNKMNMIKES